MRYETIGAVLLLFALGLSGCGPSGKKIYPVSGRVTFQGQPVSAGMIRFSNPQAGIDMIADFRDGAYEFIAARGAGLPEGTYLVTILPPRRQRPMTPPGKPIEEPLPPPAYPDIPAKYHQPSTSGLTLTIVPDGNTFDVDMQP